MKTVEGCTFACCCDKACEDNYGCRGWQWMATTNTTTNTNTNTNTNTRDDAHDVPKCYLKSTDEMTPNAGKVVRVRLLCGGFRCVHFQCVAELALVELDLLVLFLFQLSIGKCWKLEAGSGESSHMSPNVCLALL